MAVDLLSGVYEHYKGGKYLVLGTAAISDNDVPNDAIILTVVYVSLDPTLPGPRMRTRRLQEFVEPVEWPDGSGRPRFRYVGNVQ